MPFLTVIIPAYNREQYIGEAIRSALEQTRPPDEIIVVDDGSSDSTAGVAGAFGGIVRCLRQENAGVSAARNLGVEASRGELLAFLDSDDVWVPQKLEWQCRHLELHPETDMVFGHMQCFISPDMADTYQPIDTSLIPGLCAGTLFLRKETFLRIGFFNVANQAAEFIEWFSHAQDLYMNSSILPELMLKRRAHLTNTVINRAEMKSHYARVIKSILDRRRAAQSAR